MVAAKENCPEKRMEAGEDSEPMVSQEKTPEVTTIKEQELEVIVEDPNSRPIKTKVRIKVLIAAPLLFSLL